MTITISPGPRNAWTDPDSGLRFYRWQGRDLPSVTTVRRMAGLPHALHWWTVNQVVDHMLDNWRGLTERLGSDDLAQVQLVRQELRKAATAERDRAANVGLAVHDAAAEGRKLTDVPPEVAPRLRQFLDFRALSGVEILGSEFQVWNLSVGFAGTCDALVRFPNGQVWLLDYKTGKSGAYPEYALQLVAYANAEFVGEDDVVNEDLTALLQQVSGIGLLHLAERSWEFHVVRRTPELWTAFVGLLKFAMWTKTHSKPEDYIVATRRRELTDGVS